MVEGSGDKCRDILAIFCKVPALLRPSADRKGLLLSGWLKEAETNVQERFCDRYYNAGRITKIDSVWKTVFGGVTGWP